MSNSEPVTIGDVCILWTMSLILVWFFVVSRTKHGDVVRQEAVDRGYATWDTNGKAITFKWIESVK